MKHTHLGAGDGRKLRLLCGVASAMNNPTTQQRNFLRQTTLNNYPEHREVFIFLYFYCIILTLSSSR